MSDMDAWIESASAASFWTELCPEMHIEGPHASPVIHVDDALLLALRNAMLVEGYFQFDPVLPMDVMQRMAGAVKTLHEASIPLGFCFVFDEFWFLTRWIREVLSALLGPAYRQLPDQWAWFVEPGARGWPAHREKGVGSLLSGGMPKSLSIWVPLTDATTLNGCMYVVPANLDPHYRDTEDHVAVADLQTVRALPAPAGSVLLWNQALLHWGAASSPNAPAPRVSFSIEYQRGDVAPFNQPLLDPDATPPPFVQRLGMAGRQILQYEHMFEPASELVTLGRRLLQRFPIASLHAAGDAQGGASG